LLFTPGTEKLASACHGNGTDYWMISHSFGNNNFYAYQITAAGLNLTPVISSVGAIHGGPNTHALGELEVSPDASRIALCTWLGTLLQVFDFDNNTGIVSNPITLPSTGEEYGCAFSPDGSKVYYASCCISPNDIVQFDLNAGSPAAIAASRVVVWNGSPSTGKGTMQNGPDGRIYVAPLYQPSLDVILNPNAPGLTCGYSAMGFPLGGRTSLLGLPNMVSCLVTTILDAEFKAFYAEVTEMDRVQLHWSAMENTPKGTYVVERSADGAYFYEIGDVAFQGNRPELAQLSFLDRNPLPDFNLYRIKVTDPNGEVSVSEVVEVALGSALDSSLGISPNPAQNMAQLSFFVQAGHTAPWQMRVFSLAGKLLLEKNLGVLPPGHFVQDINLSRLAAGMYTFQLQCGSRKQVTQLLMME
ncbi:MAG TPA: T9SS type A sorting domain-containing protein, partial [Bacteroidetes bacterium]|nr:T9SS type A sorting domain-containing protein [Bacteroidota bacterium]